MLYFYIIRLLCRNQSELNVILLYLILRYEWPCSQIWHTCFYHIRRTCSTYNKICDVLHLDLGRVISRVTHSSDLFLWSVLNKPLILYSSPAASKIYVIIFVLLLHNLVCIVDLSIKLYFCNKKHIIKTFFIICSLWNLEEVSIYVVYLLT